ncbi:hypothetical protein [Aeromicrobium stalagmiti]|uniref:hypothetical protein n=1 Tax=Aeromicrobium stalagmiti TaxID=2738988 RepID=UPI00156840C6|nr:hypothetical protein [Aeromicrobium stalagmiti]NRQ49663.1 hypothetical protein [Aeromicrobium stalagmiti]
MRLSRVVVGAAVVLGVLSGCSGSDTTAGSIDPDSFMPDLIAAMREQGSVSITMKVTGSGGFSGEGDMVFGQDPEESDIDFRADTAGERFGIRVVDGRTFIAYDSLTDGRFYELDTDGGGALEQQLGSLADQLDPSASFEPFADSVTSVEQVGEPETVAGVESQHLRVTVDTAKIDSPELQGLPAAQLPDTFTYDFWVDDDGLLRRAAFELGGFALSGDYLDYGKTDEIPVPSGDELTTKNPFAGVTAD